MVCLTAPILDKVIINTTSISNFHSISGGAAVGRGEGGGEGGASRC